MARRFAWVRARKTLEQNLYNHCAPLAKATCSTARTRPTQIDSVDPKLEEVDSDIDMKG